MKRFRNEKKYKEEIKFVNYQKAATLITNSWARYEPGSNQLTGISQGITPNTRLGDHVLLLSLTIRGCVSRAATTGLGPEDTLQYRVIVYVDHQTNGAVAASNLILDSAIGQRVHDPYNIPNKDRFTILTDERVVFPTDNMAHIDSLDVVVYTNGQLEIPFEYDYDFGRGFPIRYKGNDNDIEDTVNNSIHIIAVADRTNVIKMTYTSHAQFVDV